MQPATRQKPQIRRTVTATQRTRAAAGRDSVAIWLQITASRRPGNLAACLGELSEPDFFLDTCRESAVLATESGRDHDYAAHWYCRFTRVARDEFADVRLLKRLTGAGFKILQFDTAQA